MQEYIDFAEHLARESARLILHHYGRPLDVERKPDQSPVTVADRDAEALMRRLIAQRYPDHQVLGEEQGLSGPEQAERRWILDPIDGTKSFIHGVPLFGTLIALMEGEEPVLGIINLPALGEIMVGARGRPTTVNGNPVRVRPTRRLDEATMCITDNRELLEQGYGPAYERIQRRVRLLRAWGDCFGHFLVAAGRIEIMFDPIMNPWDVAALKPCVLGAGGRLTDRAGKAAGLGASALSTNGWLHEELLALLGGGN
ncbi:MAG: histidinol-phosphatase [Candidatus Lambdaproteobacteria bacterium]|nr:histidinol-phosphatase [Candidatus Lambdaproteobacteria bacterium]